MKFSVLVPTRNRLELLRYAVESVRRQDDPDWELVISDNASAQDIGGYVASLGEPRVRFYRTERFVPVTENWNRALERSTGDYVLMLGDDDCLLKRYFSAQKELIERFHAPELIYADAMQFAYPGVIPDHPEAFLQIGHTAFLGDRREPFLLPRAQALDAVRSSMRFRVTFGFNMQHFLVSRRLIDALAPAGPFFQSPYPDYYAANALLLKARKALVVPRPMVAIGISRQSSGYFYFNRREEEGSSFLNNPLPSEEMARLDKVLLPGSAMNTAWLSAMETLKRNFPADATFAVDRARYRLLQIVSIWRARGALGLRKVLPRLTPAELLKVAALGAALGVIRLLPGRFGQRLYRKLAHALGAYPEFNHRRKPVPYRNILEVHEHIEPEYY